MESVEELREKLRKLRLEAKGVHNELCAMFDGEDPVLATQVLHVQQNAITSFFAAMLAQMLTGGKAPGDEEYEEAFSRLVIGADIQAQLALAQLFTNMVLTARNQGPGGKKHAGLYIASADIDLRNLKGGQ